MREWINQFSSYFDTLFNFEKLSRKNYLELKWTDEEGGIHLLEILEWKVTCWHTYFWGSLVKWDDNLPNSIENNMTNVEYKPTLTKDKQKPSFTAFILK